MRNGKHSKMRKLFAYSPLDQDVGEGVDVGRCLVQHQDRAVSHEGARHTKQLPLAGAVRQQEAPLARVHWITASKCGVHACNRDLLVCTYKHYYMIPAQMQAYKYTNAMQAALVAGPTNQTCAVSRT